MKVKNPIISGFYPDPSICAVGEDYYIVNSSFAYFPGVPIFHSRDLKNWEQIGNVLERESQLYLKGCGHSAGIFAPVIRYYDGLFYMITTNVSGGGNFIVTAKDPKGPWSDPFFLGPDAKGIDPSLFFDDDGKCYYIGTRPNPEGVRYNGDWEIWLSELDLSTMKLKGESKKLWKGAFNNVIWPEGPHIYKRNNYYYLMIAEGGTGPNHSITIARSKNIWGDYQSNPNNPILTHRHLGSNYPVVYVGHGDLVETYEGSWYIVMLASRPVKGYTNMGRETFLAEVVWEDEWPVINKGIGKLAEVFDIDLKEQHVIPKEPVYHFDCKKLPYDFVMLRNPDKDMYSLTDRPGYLRLYLKPEILNDEVSPAFIGVRQKHFDYQVNTGMEFKDFTDGGATGLAIIQNNKYHIRLEVYKNNEYFIRLICCVDGKDSCITEKKLKSEQTAGRISLKIVNRELKSDYYFKEDEDWELLVSGIDMHQLSTEKAGGFTGCVIGMYASSNGKESSSYADFNWLSYSELV